MMDAPPKAEFNTREFVGMMMDCFVSSGQLPPDLRHMATDREWAVRLQPTFVPENPDHHLLPTVFEERQHTPGKEQTRLFMGTPDQPERVYATYRVYLHCWRTQCDKRSLKWVVETQHWFAMICEDCWVCSWYRDYKLPLFLREYLANLKTLRRAVDTGGWSAGPLFAADGIAKEEPEIIIPGGLT